MNEIVNNFLLAEDTFMPEMHLKQPRFTYRTCGPFTKNKERIQKSKETGDTRYIYKNELNKVCFQHDMAYGNLKIQQKEKFKIKFNSLRDKGFNIAKNRKYDGYERDLASMVYKFFDKKTSGSGANNKIKINQQLTNELYKPIIKNFKKRTVYSSFKEIFGVLIQQICN